MKRLASALFVVVVSVVLLAAPLLAAVVGTPTHGKFGVPITGITANGETTPWIAHCATIENRPKPTTCIYAFQCWGTFDTASVKLQWELYEGAGFVDMPNTSGPYTTTATCIEGRIQLYNDTKVRVDISSVGASTDLSVILRGQGPKE